MSSTVVNTPGYYYAISYWLSAFVMVIVEGRGKKDWWKYLYSVLSFISISGDYNVVMRHICNIREKIEDDPGHPVYIQTVRGVGYRFNGNLGSE